LLNAIETMDLLLDFFKAQLAQLICTMFLNQTSGLYNL